ncbi:hypothetical protein M427DRAFT_450364 [Gonapodya prolifera JEL478]|uniref:Uncharacterized protein n=1 Tax=Gonapodya prolifera (strain JEL478) TaxID=1344416 RepID=A0A139ARZ9_GONPJ|nr:hypothetical protein M427DRAFT_450364 [Gonapodya prolifera JEL478]|eukprot:KXS19424.1 hypothetical protein M427DRAFT_450364 [Gonapodya prolifera JEL478]
MFFLGILKIAAVRYLEQRRCPRETLEAPRVVFGRIRPDYYVEDSAELFSDRITHQLVWYNTICSHASPDSYDFCRGSHLDVVHSLHSASICFRPAHNVVLSWPFNCAPAEYLLEIFDVFSNGKSLYIVGADSVPHQWDLEQIMAHVPLAFPAKILSLTLDDHRRAVPDTLRIPSVFPNVEALRLGHLQKMCGVTPKSREWTLPRYSRSGT